MLCCMTPSWFTIQTSLQLSRFVCKYVDIGVQLHRRIFKFVNSCMNSKNKIFKLCYNLAITGSGSYISNSINYIASVCKLNKYNMGSIKLNKHNVDTETNIRKADEIKHFISMCEDIVISGSKKQNLISINDYLCKS